MTISAAGFGRRIPWGDDEVPPGHELSFKRSVEILGTGLFVRLVCPKWLFEWAPTEKIREARDGFAEFRVSTTYTLPGVGTLQRGSDATSIVLPNGDD